MGTCCGAVARTAADLPRIEGHIQVAIAAAGAVLAKNASLKQSAGYQINVSAVICLVALKACGTGRQTSLPGADLVLQQDLTWTEMARARTRRGSA